MAKRNFERTLASIFIIVGVVCMSTPDFLQATPTGNAIVSNAVSSLNLVFVLALLLTIIGGILFFRSFKR